MLLPRSVSWAVVFFTLTVCYHDGSLVNGSIQIPHSRWGFVSPNIQYVYDSVVLDDVGESLEDGITYGAYLNLPPHSIDLGRGNQQLHDLEIYRRLCNGPDYTKWLYRQRQRQRQRQLKENIANGEYVPESYDPHDDEHLIQRALLVKEGGCSYEEKMQTALRINELYRSAVFNGDTIQGKKTGTNIIRYLILYKDTDDETENDNENPEYLQVTSTTHNHNNHTHTEDERRLPMKFLSVDARTGEILKKMLIDRFYSAGVRSGRSTKDDPFAIGRMILMDNDNVPQQGRSDKKENIYRILKILHWYGFYFMVFACLMLGAFFKRHFRCRRYSSSSSSSQATTVWTWRWRLVVLTSEERQRRRQRTAMDVPLSPILQRATLTKEQVLSLPEVTYRKGFYNKTATTKMTVAEAATNDPTTSASSSSSLVALCDLEAETRNGNVGGIVGKDDDTDRTNDLQHETTIQEEENNKDNNNEKDDSTPTHRREAESFHDSFTENVNTTTITSGRNGEECLSVDVDVDVDVDPSHSSTCFICLDDYSEGETIRMLPCGHLCHTECILPWLTEKADHCPLCKTTVVFS